MKTAKNGGFCEELFGKDYVKAALASFCYYDHGAKASEAVQKIKKSIANAFRVL